MPDSEEEFESQQHPASCGEAASLAGLGPELTPSSEWNGLASILRRKSLTPHNPLKNKKEKRWQLFKDGIFKPMKPNFLLTLSSTSTGVRRPPLPTEGAAIG